MAELGNRISPVFLDSSELTEHFDSILSKPDDSKVTHVMMKELIRQINHSLDEIDTKVANLKGGAEAITGAGGIIDAAYAKSSTFVTITTEVDLVTVSFTTTGGTVFAVGSTEIFLSVLNVGGGFQSDVTTRLKRDTTELDLRVASLNLDPPPSAVNTSHIQVVNTMLHYGTLAAGTYTFKLTGQRDTGNQTCTAVNKSIFVAEIDL